MPCDYLGRRLRAAYWIIEMNGVVAAKFAAPSTPQGFHHLDENAESIFAGPRIWLPIAQWGHYVDCKALHMP